eukprot:g8453.t1
MTNANEVVEDSTIESMTEEDDDNREDEIQPPFSILLRRPLSLLAVVPAPVVWFLAGAIAGATGKTIIAPLERVKLLLQVKGGFQTGAVKDAALKGGIFRSLIAISRTEGIGGFWKGNLPQILRIVPYSAVQLSSYEVLKRLLRRKDGELPVRRRLFAGACAGMLATTITYPLDTIRFRLAVDPSVATMQDASMALIKESGIRSLYRGVKPAILGIAPYMAIELAAFDLLPKHLPAFVRGFAAAFLATTCCYPLDTVRRQIQLILTHRASFRKTFIEMVKEDGLGSVYRGFVPNAVKNLPNKGIRYSTFEAVKSLLLISRSIYTEQCAFYSKQQKLQKIS